jgi:sialate O-acetylesterase
MSAVLLLVGCATGVSTEEEQARQAPREMPLELASPFVDNAVLQREMVVPVWGWATPGSQVTVAFAGQSRSATADAKGKWIVKLDPLEASVVERELTATSSRAESITCKGVLVGEVWFASGQSNMEWVAGKSMCVDLARSLERSKENVPIREYQVDIGSSLFPQSRTSADDGWKGPDKAGGFSALALSFAGSLHEELRVPIGIVRSSHGATPIETWTPYEGFASHPKLQDIAAKIRRSDPTTPEGKEAYAKFHDDLRRWQAESEAVMARGGAALPRPKLPGIGAEWKGASRMYNMKIQPLIPYAIRGAIWCQGTSNGNDGRIYAAKMEALADGWREKWGRPDLPFYFTQQQCYGQPDPDHVGFADLREAQRLFFMNAKNVGMVLQHDLNSARPTGIHYYNKLDPGKRLARWALAHEYGRDVAYCGPVYKSHSIEGDTVRVRFEQRGPGGALMVGSKGMAVDRKKGPDAYVEPARETPGEKLKHFRLAGRDRKWHAAEAVIEGGEVVVTGKAVPEPVGVQYAYSGTPMGANLYNRAGLPATPFAYFKGKQLFNEDDPAFVAAEEARLSRYIRKPSLQPMSLLRDRLVIQRDLPVPVWGHGVPGTEITVVFGDQSRKTVVDEFEKWLVTLDPMPASSEGRDLKIICSDDTGRTIKDVVVGDVWVLTGARNLSGEFVVSSRSKDKAPPPAMPLLREFRIRTKTRRFRSPRKRRMEIGGGKYVASWRPAVFTETERDTSVAAYYFASQVRERNVPIGIINTGADNPPLTWISYEGVQKAVGFEKERDELNLLYPDTDSCKAAVEAYIATMKKYTADIVALRNAGRELPAELAEKAPAFPEPYYNHWASYTETACQTYNFCVCPLTPFAVRGVAWIPGEKNIGKDVSKYAPALKAYAASLARTYGQDTVPFVFTQPSVGLVDGIAKPEIENAMGVEFDQWPRSLQEIAGKLGASAAGRGR